MKPVQVIAEIGINHNGDVGIALELIRMAAAAGCDLVKFQKRNVPVVYRGQLETPRESAWGSTLGEQKYGLELERTDYNTIDRFCHKIGIPWFASAWDLGSLEFLGYYETPCNKVASPMLAYTEFVEAVAAQRKPTFISTGMAGVDLVDSVVDRFRTHGCPFTLLHCVSVYPTPEDQLNLQMIEALRVRYGCDVGYSGHEVSPMPSIMAAVCGATAIERHVTLDRAMVGSDHAASLEPRGLDILVKGIRSWEAARGDGVWRVLQAEQDNADKLQWYKRVLRGVVGL